MNPLLKNAVVSIQLGLEDFASDDERRIISAVATFIRACSCSVKRWLRRTIAGRFQATFCWSHEAEGGEGRGRDLLNSSAMGKKRIDPFPRSRRPLGSYNWLSICQT